MTNDVRVPTEWVEAVANLKTPAGVDQRLQELMTLNNDGKLTQNERAELDSLAELSERISLIRAEALRLLERRPMQRR